MKFCPLLSANSDILEHCNKNCALAIVSEDDYGNDVVQCSILAIALSKTNESNENNFVTFNGFEEKF